MYNRCILLFITKFYIQKKLSLHRGIDLPHFSNGKTKFHENFFLRVTFKKKMRVQDDLSTNVSM